MLAEPGGELDATLDPAAATPGPSQRSARFAAAADLVAKGDIDGALQLFFDTIDGEGAWARLPAAPRQQLRDNAATLIGQVGENRRPYSKTDAQSIRTPTLFIGGADTKGALPAVLRALAAEVRGAQDRDHTGHPALDVRAGAAAVFEDRAGVSGGVAGAQCANSRMHSRHASLSPALLASN